jgi:hypothetical protein
MKEKNQKGQALIELIVFLPLIITLYSVIGGFAASINGSINQQKITRAYFYYRAQNNSTIPKPDANRVYMNWNQFGMFYIGWKESFVGGETPVMPCYRINIPFKTAPTDKCEDAYTNTNTLFVRVGTVYGICGTTFVKINNHVHYAPDRLGIDYKQVIDRNSCIIR